MFETIKRFLEKIYMIWIGMIFKTKRLRIINGLLKRTMEESIFLYLVDGWAMRRKYRC